MKPDAAPQHAVGGLAGKRVLVTGAAGFIGSHLTEQLARAGAEVTALVRDHAQCSNGNLVLLPAGLAARLRFTVGNIEDGNFVLGAVEDMDVVFHLAALVNIPHSRAFPCAHVHTNLLGTLNLLEAARRGAIGRLVHTSSSEVYGEVLAGAGGEAGIHVVGETRRLQALSPYAASKIAADKLAESYWHSYDVDVVTVRPFNTYGPRQSADALVPAIIAQVLWRERILLGNLTRHRDLSFVQDTVAGFLAAATVGQASGETFDLGSGSSVAIGEVARRVLRLVHADKPIVLDACHQHRGAQNLVRPVADIGKARAALEWVPRTELDDGLSQTIAFVAAHRNRYDPGRHAG